MSQDPYARSEYRRLIAWDRRIEREGPWLRRLLADAPDRSLLDLGCGTGEHVAFFAKDGVRAVGLDRSGSMIEQAREHEARGHGHFVEGDALTASEALGAHAPFGLALCLGNMLPHVTEDHDLARFVESVRTQLVPGGSLLVQLLNYARILAQDVPALPVNVRAGEDGRELVFLRLMRPLPEGRVLFIPTTLELDPEAESPLRLERSRRVELRAWRAAQLREAFEAQGFELTLHGDMRGGPFDVEASHDLVLRATRRR